MPKTICLDFDGVLHRYDSGWQGVRVIPDPPTDGAIDFLLQLLAEGWDVAIFSTRSTQWGGRRAMKRWLRSVAFEHYLMGLRDLQNNDPNGIETTHKWSKAGLEGPLEGSDGEDAGAAADWFVRQIRWPSRKPPAFVGLDDRVIQFKGHFPSTGELAAFKPWNRG